MSTHSAADFRPRVLFVCRANQCRSVAAQMLARDGARHRAIAADFVSAGTEAIEGGGLHPKTAAFLGARGLLDPAWSAHRLNAERVADADLILAADSSQLYVVGSLLPHAAPRSFTLLQFAHLAGGFEPQPRRSRADFEAWLQASTVAARSRVAPPADIDIPDPVRFGRRRFDRCMNTIADAVDSVLTVLAG